MWGKRKITDVPSVGGPTGPLGAHLYVEVAYLSRTQGLRNEPFVDRSFRRGGLCGLNLLTYSFFVRKQHIAVTLHNLSRQCRRL